MARTDGKARRISRLGGVAAVATAGVVALGVAAPGASAAPVSRVARASAARAPYNGVCGAGYTVVNFAPVGSVGMAYLTWNASTGYNCVVEIRDTPGDPVLMAVGIAKDEIRDNNDVGYYRSYAGPLYEAGRGMCVNWWGSIGTASFVEWQTNCG
ncbi:spore-associated protein A [Streptomyces polygonati]|uniref:Spore-associated protein A n=1 Tax=Streptomyces polygonati TaxID=1617087 RepID=A0ABV8HG22_9ACTN